MLPPIRPPSRPCGLLKRRFIIHSAVRHRYCCSANKYTFCAAAAPVSASPRHLSHTTEYRRFPQRTRHYRGLPCLTYRYAQDPRTFRALPRALTCRFWSVSPAVLGFCYSCSPLNNYMRLLPELQEGRRFLSPAWGYSL